MNMAEEEEVDMESVMCAPGNNSKLIDTLNYCSNCPKAAVLQNGK